LSKARESELERGAGQLVDLIEVLRLAHLLGRGDEEGSEEEQAVVAIS